MTHRTQQAQHRRRVASMSFLGAAPAALPTQAGSGAGWIAVVVSTPPNARISWSQTSGTNPSLMLVLHPPIGPTLQEVALGSGETGREFNYLTSGQTFVFYLLPTDANGNSYAPVEQVNVKGEPGIYVSPSVPADVVAGLKAANPGLQLYGTAAQQNIVPAVTPWYDQPTFGTSVPVWGALLIGGAIVFGPRLMGQR